MKIKRLAPGYYSAISADGYTTVTIERRSDLAGPQWVASHDSDRYAYGDPEWTLADAKVTALALLNGTTGTNA
jgi:hypothetical protein